MKSEAFMKFVNTLKRITKGKVDETNAKYVIGGGFLLIVLVVGIVILSLKGCGEAPAPNGANVNSKELETQHSATAETNETMATEQIIPLEENAYQEVNELVDRYFQAMADGDMDTVNAIEYPMTDMKQLTISAKSEYIDSFENIVVYTKPGPIEDSLIVFVYNEVKFTGIETTAAAVNTLYACKDEAGNYYFFGGEIAPKEEEFINEVIGQQDVIDLFNRADVKFQEAVDSDTDLAKMLTDLPDRLKEKVGEAVASLNAETQESAEETVETVSEDSNDVDYEMVKANDTINVRMAASEDADKLGKLEIGTIVKRIESLDNGWSRIEYENGEGYVKTEFVSVNSVVYKDGTSKNLSGKVSPTTTINVRTSASENADKIGVANAGEEFDLLEVLENGWTKIKYDGKEAYVKSEYLK